MNSKQKRVSKVNFPSKKRKTCDETTRLEENVPEICTTPTSSKLTETEQLTPKFLFGKKESKYFKYMTYIYIDKVKHGICKICVKKLGENNVKPILIKDGNTSGVNYHYRVSHNQEYALLFEDSASLKQQTIFEVMKIENLNSVAEEVNMNRVITCWISYKNLPLNFFDDEITENFFNLINDDLDYPRRNVLGNLLSSHIQEMRDNFKVILENIESKMAFTVDAWWSKNKASYYAITVHYLSLEWELMSTILDIIPLEGKHCGEDIANVFYSTLKSFGIAEKVIGKIYFTISRTFIIKKF